MTEQDVIDLYVASGQNAQAVLQFLVDVATLNAASDASVTLANGQTYQVPSEAKRAAAINAAFDALKLAFVRDNVAPPTKQFTRNAGGQITQIDMTLASGWKVTRTFTRANSGALSGRITSGTVTVKDAMDAVLAGPFNRTLNYDANNRIASVT